MKRFIALAIVCLASTMAIAESAKSNDILQTIPGSQNENAVMATHSKLSSNEGISIQNKKKAKISKHRHHHCHYGKTKHHHYHGYAHKIGNG